MHQSATERRTDVQRAYAAGTEQPAPVPRRERLSRGFRALESPNYRRYFFGQLVSLTGGWMQTTGQAWLVLQLTKSPFALGLVTTLQFLPIMLLTLFGGVIADRFPKRKLILATQITGLIQAALFTLLVATGTVQLWHVYVLAALLGIINAIDNPARQAFAVELVGRDKLVNAVALNSMLFNAARIVGPAAAGLIIASVGIAPVLGLNALSFLGAILALIFIDERQLHIAPPKERGRVMTELGEGLAYAWRTPSVLMVLIVVAAIGTFGYNFSVVMPLLAEFVLHTNATGFGGLSAFLGIGSLVAALTTAYKSHLSFTRLLLASFSFSALYAAIAVSPFYALTAALLIALGFAGITFATTANTLLQLTVPDDLRGRVMSIYMLLFAGTTPIGSFLIGVLSDRAGVSQALLVCAALCAIGVGIALVYARKHGSSSTDVRI